MLKLGTKRRRSKAEILQLKEEEELKVGAEAAKTARIFELESKLRDIEDTSKNNNAAADILTDLISKGHVHQNFDGSVSALNQLNDPGLELDEEDKAF